MSKLGSAKRRLVHSSVSLAPSSARIFKKPLSRNEALVLLSRSKPLFIRRSFRPPKERPLAPPKAKILPFRSAPPLVRKFAIGVASSLIAFSPMKSHGMDSREPPPNPGWYTVTERAQILDKRQWGGRK